MYISESITSGTPLQPFCFSVCVRVCVYHFVFLSTKVCYQYFMYLLCSFATRQTTGVWHTGKCKLRAALAVMLLYTFTFANKGSLSHFCGVPTHSHQGAERPQIQQLGKLEQNTIFIHYIHYIQCNTTRLSTHSLYPQSSAYWSESTSLKNSWVPLKAWETGKMKTVRKLKFLHSGQGCVENINPKLAKRKEKYLALWVSFFCLFFFDNKKVRSIYLL